MRRVLFSVAGVICAQALLPAAPAGGLSLDEALLRAAGGRFELALARRDLEAGQGRILQASVRPGVEADLETRNALEETSVGVSIVQERGGKRDARVAVARADFDLIAAQAEVRRLDVGHQVRRTFNAVLAAEQSLGLAEAALELARSFSGTVAEKVRAGAASPVEETRAAVRLHGASADVERARRGVALTRAELALAVGDPAVRAETLEGSLPEDTTVPDAPEPAAEVSSSPDVRILEHAVLSRRSALAEERSRATPDLTWRAAANHSRIDEESWLTVGVSFPLFSAGRNRGALTAAAAEVERAALEHAAADRRLADELARARAGLLASAREAAILRNDVLAGAEQALSTVQEGYRLGKFPYLDVLDASEVLLDARRRYAAALADLAQARLDVDRLLGRTGLPSSLSAR